jgi:zinc-ribbon domain
VACASCGTELPGGARFCLQCGHGVAAGAAVASPSPAPETYTPKHLAERILNSKATLEGERKQVTVLFRRPKGSMERLHLHDHTRRSRNRYSCERELRELTKSSLHKVQIRILIGPYLLPVIRWFQYERRRTVLVDRRDSS